MTSADVGWRRPLDASPLGRRSTPANRELSKRYASAGVEVWGLAPARVAPLSTFEEDIMANEPKTFEVIDKDGDTQTFQGSSMAVDSHGTLSIVTNDDAVVCAYGPGQWQRGYRTGSLVSDVVRG
jgi:hypothetical protein